MIPQNCHTIDVLCRPYNSVAYVLPCDTVMTRNSAIADKPREAFRGQLRSPNMVPSDMLGIVSY